MSSNLKPKELDLLHRLDANEDLRPLFFRKFKGLKWFNALDERMYFKPDHNPRPIPAQEEGYVHIPDWIAIEYLVNTAPELSNPANKDYAEKFLKILKDVTKYSKETGNSNYRTWWRFSQIIKYIPHTLIHLEDLEIVDYWLEDKFDRGLVAEEVGENWLSMLLEMQDDEHANTLAKRLLEIIYRVTFTTKLSGLRQIKASFRFDSYHAKKLTESIAARAGHKLGVDAVKIFDFQLRTVLEKLGNDSWSCIWHSAVEDHEQNKYQKDPENILIVAYRESLEVCLADKSIEIVLFVIEMLNSEFETVQRIAIHSISRHFELFTENIDLLISEKYLSANHRYEMWHFLKLNYEKLSENQKHTLLKMISNIRREDDEGNYHKAATAYAKAIWLAALSDAGKTEEELYRTCVEIAKSKPEHPDFSSYTTTSRGEHKSKFSLEELQSLDIDDLVHELSEERETGTLLEEESIEGLTKTFRKLIKTEPLRFYLSLKKFADLDLAFIYEVIEAFKDLWVEKTQLPWDDVWLSLFEFCEHIISQKRFWLEESATRRGLFLANRNWIVSSIGRLIEAGTKSDEHAFNEKYLDYAKGILLQLMAHQPGEEYKLDSDAVSISINSPRGQCIEALINLVLRKCRREDRECGEHSKTWSEYEELFNAELSRSEWEHPEYEFATLVTNYLPNFCYMSKEWLLSKLPNIFDQSHYQKWLCALQGYAYVGIVYEEIYRYMSRSGDLIKALDDENIRERVQEKIIQNIVIAYVHEYESVDSDGSLLKKILHRNNYGELSHLIWFMWTQRNSADNEVVSKKVFEIWPIILRSIDFESKDGMKLASQLCHWAVFVTEVNDDTLELLMKVAPYAEVSYNSYDLIKSLAELSKKYPFEAYDVWKEILKVTAEDYPEDAIRELFKNLVTAGEEGVRRAREIESQFIKRGNERPSLWLREIRDHYKFK